MIMSRPSPATVPSDVVGRANKTDRLLALALIVLIYVSMAATAPTLASENYDLQVNDEVYSIELDRTNEITLSSGEVIRVKISLKETVEFESTYFSFFHKSDFKPQKQDLGEGVIQTAIVTGTGSVILVQEYTSLDPSGLVDFMLQELTKDDVDYGYELESSEVAKSAGGKSLIGKKAITTFGDEQWTYYVYAFGAKEGGILIVTTIESGSVDKDMFLFDDFWRTLKIRL